jgi:hypothetical protein
MGQHPCAALTHEGRSRTDMVEVLVGKDYAPEISHSYAGLEQDGADRLRLIRKACIYQRVAVVLVHDQGQVEVTVSILWAPWYGQDVHVASKPHSSPHGLLLLMLVHDFTSGHTRVELPS